MQEEYTNVITLTDSDGSDVDFEVLDIVPYKEHEYAVLLPVDDESDSPEAVILELLEAEEDNEEDMLQGVAMTRKLLLEAVARHGLTPVGTAGEAFTPELHEAVGFDAEADVEAGAVARVLQSGYKLGERLLRPAKVMIKQG